MQPYITLLASISVYIMTAKDLINNKLNPLYINMEVGEALEEMNLSGLSHLPVVDDLKIIGILSAENLATLSPDELVTDYIEKDKTNRVYENVHVFELLKFFGQSETTSLAVVDKDDNFIGIVPLTEMLFEFQNRYQPLQKDAGEGGIITLEMEWTDYKLSEIAHIVESNGSKIIGLYVSLPNAEQNKVEVDIQFDRADVKSILATFERFKYQVRASHISEEDWQLMQQRYNALMKYLSM